MQMQYTGTNPLHIDSSLSRILAVGTLIHLVLLSASVAQRALLGERRLRDEKDRVIAVAQAAERDLTIKRSEEHTSELQSLMRISYAVFCLKKKKKPTYNSTVVNGTS